MPKKYAEGVRTLSTPGDAVKLRLRFAPQVLRRYWKFHSMWKRKNAQFFFTSQRQRANTSVFFEICGFLLYWDLVLYLSFRAGIYGTKTGLFSRKIKFVIFACSFASIAAALRRRTFFPRKKSPKKYTESLRALSTPGDAVKLRSRDLWGAAPYPARFF